MKKNKMLRTASLLLVLVLLTTSIISGTYAKYTTSASSFDSARIAKWGIGAPASFDFDLFATDAFDTGKVLSADDTAVLAPGTSKTLTVNLFTVTGAAPEVKYDYTVDLAIDKTASTTIAKLDSLDGFKWTLKAPGAAETEYAKFADFQTAVNALSQTGIEPGHLPNGYATGANTMTIGWVWDFGDPTNNEADTAAGNEAATPDTLDTFKLTLTITAEQVD